MIKIYSSLTRKKEDFKPLKEGEVKMYACGVTPYDDIHIGHARQAIVYDVIRAYLEFVGYDVLYVRNHTDVDDKIIKKANQAGKECLEISSFYIKQNTYDLDALGVRRATYEPKVTECIPDIIAYIKVLVNKGYAYIVDGEVFFEIDKFNDYGNLSNRKKDDLINSDESSNKKRPNDFVLWKPAKQGEPSWDSPWSKGRPGWHIECSVMAYKYLGESVDIHGGGIDLIFPHHENEIAQSEGFSGNQFAKYWLHNGLVMINGVKMSKSLGNFLTVKDALKKYYPEEIRYTILTHNFSSNVDFSDKLFLNARKRLHYFYGSLLKIENIKKDTSHDVEIVQVPEIISNFHKKYIELMNDNFNTPRVISEITEIFKELNRVIDSKQYSLGGKKHIVNVFNGAFNKIATILGIFEEEPGKYLAILKRKILKERGMNEKDIQAKLGECQSSRLTKDYQRADSIKNELIAKGISVQDTPTTIKWDIIL